MKIASALVASLLFLSAAHGQSVPEFITPRFVPAQHRTPAGAIPAGFTPPQPQPAMQQMPGRADESEGPLIRTELPGQQRLFQRVSEQSFFDGLAQSMRKSDGTRAIFPEEPVVSKAPYRPRNFPKMVELVEPCYVCHRRLYWEQPNFERIGYDLGYLQPAVCLGVFYYDTALLPYHVFSDLHGDIDCSYGKCMPGDQAPFLVPCERFSVTGLVGQSATMIGLGFLLR